MKKLNKGILYNSTFLIAIFLIFFNLKQKIEDDRIENNLNNSTFNISFKEIKNLTTKSALFLEIKDTISTNNIFSTFAK
jgi:hypothetical protein